jgi:zinc transporter
MTFENGIIHALKFNGDGSASELKGQDISDTVHSDDLAWVHFDARDPASGDWIEKEVDYLDRIIIDALLAEETRPRFVEHENGVLLILRGMNFNENERHEDMVSIRIWADEHRIITLQRRQLKATKDIAEKLVEGKGPKDAADFLVQISSRLFDRMEPVLSELDEKLDDLEELIMEDPDGAHRQKITEIRKKAIVFRRYIAPQKDVMMSLRTVEQDWISSNHRRRIQESLDRVTRFVEDLDAARERAQIIKDELANALADKMNKNLYMLSLVAAIFLPLGFLTGMLGINVGGIPGADNEGAFMIFTGILVVLVAAQLVLFRWLKWI